MTKSSSSQQILQTAKMRVRACQADQLAAPHALPAHCSAEYRWRGCEPFGTLHAATDVAQHFWQPLHASLMHLQRREDIFFAGWNAMDNESSLWVVSMGHLMGLFDAAWLGIPPTRRMAFLRYASFDCVTRDSIIETAMFFDIPHLMIQAGLQPFPHPSAAHLVQPGPITHDGLLTSPQTPEEGSTTLAAINAMIADLGQWQLGLPLEEELARTWHNDMIWWGPAGIGSTYTIERYAKQHAGPFRASFSNRSTTTHTARLAEGSFGGFFGWPNFTATLSAPFMGLPATGRAAEFRVVDIYRRAGDKLAENWVLIDLLHFWNQQGIDILKRATQGH